MLRSERSAWAEAVTSLSPERPCLPAAGRYPFWPRSRPDAKPLNDLANKVRVSVGSDGCAFATGTPSATPKLVAPDRVPAALDSTSAWTATLLALHRIAGRSAVTEAA